MKKYFLIIVSLVLLSCSENDEIFELNTDKSEITLSSIKKQDTFTITTNEEWKIKAPSLEYGLGTMISEGKFYILSQGMGTKEATVKVELKEDFKGVAEETLTIKTKHKSIAILLKKE